MDKTSRDKRFIRKPIYSGGQKAYKAFIKQQLVYPQEAMDQRVEGFVQLKYDINHLGKVISAKIISSLGHGCDEEAIRIVKLLEFEIPKGPRKLKVTFHKTVRIHFKIPVKQAKIQPKRDITNPVVEPTVNYQIIMKKPKVNDSANQESPNRKAKKYTYTITLS